MNAPKIELQEVGELSESLEDYLEIIFRLINERQVARVKDIARRKNVRTASVSNALKRLADANLIDYRTREYVQLTDEGRELAHRINQRHLFIKRFLTDILRVAPATAERDACNIEHQLSLETLDHLASFYEYITSCPQHDRRILERFKECVGDGGPGASKGDCPAGSVDELCIRHTRQIGAEMPREEGNILTLLDLKPGERAQVLRLRARQEIRQRLIDMGVLPRVEITMERPAPMGDPIKVKLKGYMLSLRKEEAAAIHVVRIPYAV